MKRCISLVVFALCALATPTTTIEARNEMPGQVSAQSTRPGTAPRRVECKKEAQGKKFGAQFVKGNRFLKECLAR
jgi:hypothetical protein